jgi:hypothetical protein
MRSHWRRSQVPYSCHRSHLSTSGIIVTEQTHAPDFDLVAKLKARRLRWLGHVLRMPETSLLRRVVLRHGNIDLAEGSIFDDAPPRRRSTPRWRS